MWLGLLEAVIPSAIWGLVVWRLGVFAINKFEASISRAADRLKKLGPAEFDSLPEQQTTALPPPTGSISVGDNNDPSSLIGRYEAKTKQILAQFPEQERLVHLTRMAIFWQIWWNFETIYSRIFGSQLALLQVLNSQTATLEQARKFYDQAAASYPEFYQTYTFEQWLGWLQNDANCFTHSSGLLNITEDGREFLKYMIGRGYSMSRPG